MVVSNVAGSSGVARLACLSVATVAAGSGVTKKRRCARSVAHKGGVGGKAIAHIEERFCGEGGSGGVGGVGGSGGEGGRTNVGDLSANASTSRKRPEAAVRDALAASIPGSMIEVACSSGFADIVTSEEVIEVKRAQLWKGGLGQVLVYSRDFPGLRPRLHLFGNKTYDHFAVARTTCEAFGVYVTTEPSETKQEIEAVFFRIPRGSRPGPDPLQTRQAPANDYPGPVSSRPAQAPVTRPPTPGAFVNEDAATPATGAGSRSWASRFLRYLCGR